MVTKSVLGGMRAGSKRHRQEDRGGVNSEITERIIGGVQRWEDGRQSVGKGYSGF